MEIFKLSMVLRFASNDIWIRSFSVIPMTSTKRERRSISQGCPNCSSGIRDCSTCPTNADCPAGETDPRAAPRGVVGMALGSFL